MTPQAPDKIEVRLGTRSYDILIADGLVDRLTGRLWPFVRDRRLIVVTDENVWTAAGKRFVAGLDAIEAVPIILPPGEATKSWDGLRSLVDRLLELGVERSDHIVAFGGGVIGDLTGFAAAILNRGCGFVAVPTTLLSQVDSSVGGKTAINVTAGKNLIGAFHQPAQVLIDPSLLQTLDKRQMRAGYAEIAKLALIEDAGLFDWLKANGSRVIDGEPDACLHSIRAAVTGKGRIVEADEQETNGRRALLNLGHTFGHALEAETGYSDRLLHGEAVALGCILAFDFSAARGLCDAGDAADVRTHFAAIGLPTRLEEIGLAKCGQMLVRHMGRDKKKKDGRVAFILVKGIGKAFVDKSVDLAEVADFLDKAP